jgi:predicted ATPase
MWYSRLLLRWYKSFNTRFEPLGGHSQPTIRPWEKYESEFFPYVEIPLDRRITTVVGANESGKSHLLSGISKVCTGCGNGDDADQRYAKQDICRYCAFEELEKNVWPTLGIEITFENEEERKKFLDATNVSGTPPPTIADASTWRCTVVLNGSQPESKYAAVYGDDDAHLGDIPKTLWEGLCKEHLPAYQYIDARTALSNEVHVNQLLAMYRQQAPGPAYDPLVLQSLATDFSSLSLVEGQAVPKDTITAYKAVVAKLQSNILGPSKPATLEAKLFRDVLGVPEVVLNELATLGPSDRGYVERRVAEINHRLNERLDITHFWQQDDAFRLTVVYKSGFFYFEITDRTGATYTFNERSSGLRFFLSYYIQAKAIEKASEKTGSIVVMDEPDGFLSVAGQRNLLRIFESLVSPKQSSGTCQLVYTTHSPFLINRNYPQRLRLVRKGDGSEGTQYVKGGVARRHEPIRSALGIDCSETLFMGAVNIVVEGPTDQKVIIGGIQRFGSPSAVDDFLDLNKVTFVSAGGISHVRKLIEKSDTDDDKRPVVVVLLDGDIAGNDAYQEITANNVLDSKFITTLDQIILDTPWNGTPKILEDIIPPKLLAEAIVRYLRDRWKETVTADESLTALTATSNGDNIAKRIITFSKAHMGTEKSHLSDADVKAGVLDALVELVIDDNCKSFEAELTAFEKNVRKVCEKIQAMIDEAEGQARRDIMHKCVRLVEERFRKSHVHSATKADIDRFLRRFEGECVGLSHEARQSREHLVELRSILEQEVSGANDLVEITAWKQRFASFKERPWKRPKDGWK